jgi:poly-gamma-glutamate synthesis protein (capsule biosynthesis protein)
LSHQRREFLRLLALAALGTVLQPLHAQQRTVMGKQSVILFSFGMETSGIGWDWGATAHHPGVNLLHDLSIATVRNIAQQVQRIKRAGDIVIASIHWGGNWGYAIPDDQQQFAHALIDDASVDLIHGHSSHHIKGIEVYKNHLILYGCGDLLNDYEGIGGYEEYRDELGLMYFPTLNPVDGKLLRLEMTPTRRRKMRINRASHEEAQWLADVLNRESKTVGANVTLDENNRLVLTDI